jgi:hypothetical protein
VGNLQAICDGCQKISVILSIPLKHTSALKAAVIATIAKPIKQANSPVKPEKPPPLLAVKG